MQTLTIKVDDNYLEKIINLLKKIPEDKVEVIENITQKSQVDYKDDDEKWTYWKDAELDNFGKIAIGLSLHDYDKEDYSKW